MQVDRSNFEAVLPEILKNIQLADFVSFDCEFTGLVTKLQRIEGMFPNYIEFYERIKETAYNFRIIQLGLSAFVFKQGKYQPCVYNLFISPSTFTPGFNNVMVCEVESLEFLAQNKLDFNRVFCKGIKSKRLYSNDIDQKHQYNQFPMSNLEDMFPSPEDEAFIHEIETNVVAEIANNFKLERIVDFKTRGLFSYIRLKYPDMLFDKTKKGMKQFEYSVRFRPKMEKHEPEIASKVQNFQAEKQKSETNTMQKQKPSGEKEKEQIAMQPEGVDPGSIEFSEGPCLSKVFELLISSKKPLIGHFPNLDIGLIYQTFLADLPETYEQFCYNLAHCFPFIYDTKVISRKIQSKIKGIRVDLASLFKACSNPKLLKPYSNFVISGLENYVEKEHEAGYDAFITGCSFIGMANFLRGESGRVDFNFVQTENLLLFSRFSGEVSVSGNGYCSNAVHYDNLILIQPHPKDQVPKWKQIARELSKFGSLSVHEDRSEIYYVYEEPRNTLEIMKAFPGLGLKLYKDRRIIKARNMYKQLMTSHMMF